MEGTALNTIGRYLITVLIVTIDYGDGVGWHRPEGKQ
jgi:hypothetical protein